MPATSSFPFRSLVYLTASAWLLVLVDKYQDTWWIVWPLCAVAVFLALLSLSVVRRHYR